MPTDVAVDYKRLIEAALFMSPKALSVAELSGITGVASMGHVEEMIKQLVAEYSASGTALQIFEIDKKFMLGLREPYASRVSSMASGPDLSRGALRILAYISKNEDALQSAIVKLFGESTYEYVKELREKEFLETKKEGRSRKLMTTTKFKEYFNV